MLSLGLRTNPAHPFSKACVGRLSLYSVKIMVMMQACTNTLNTLQNLLLDAWGQGQSAGVYVE